MKTFLMILYLPLSPQSFYYFPDIFPYVYKIFKYYTKVERIYEVSCIYLYGIYLGHLHTINVFSFLDNWKPK